MDSIFGMVRLDGQAIDPLELERLAGDPVETWIDNAVPSKNQARIVWVTPGVALGYLPSQGAHHRMQGEQPWLHPETGHAITADVQLDNRRELCTALQLEQGRSEDLHDGQLILLAWMQWGERCLDRLQGDFTFALWDPSRQSLFCVRDRLGARVQGFVKHQDYLAFASDSEWLVRLPGLTGRPSPTGIAELIDWRFPMLGERATWRDEVQTVLPGECLTITRGGAMTFRTWWAVEPVKSAHYVNDDEVEQHFLEVFGAAVKCRMGERYSAAALMSGGLDSVAVASVARNFLPTTARFSSYSCVYDGSEKCIESESIFSLIDSLKANATVTSSSSVIGSSGSADLLHIAWSRPHPMESSLLVPALCCLAARRAEETAMLHGVSGDIVTGVPLLYMTAYFRSWHWRNAIRECVSANENNVYLRDRGLAWIVARSLLGAFLPPPAQRIMRRMKEAGARAAAPSSVMHPYLYQEYLRKKAQSDAESRSAASFSVPGMASLYSGLSGFGRIGRRFGIRMRDPWADVRVLKFFLALPIHHKVQQGWTKYPIRRAFRNSVKPEVLWRRDKEHVGWRFTRQLMEVSDDFVRDTLNDGLHVIADYVDIDAVRKVMSQYHPEKSVGSIDLVRNLVTLISWLRR